MNRPIQAELAKSLGLSQATISLALQGHARISAATRQRVRDAAQKLGYRPDPMLSALASYRHENRPPAFHGTIGLVSSNSMELGTNPLIAEAARLGYQLEAVCVGRTAKEQRHAARVLKARGIVGLAVMVGDIAAAKWDFDWSDFAVVDLSGLMRVRDFPRVTTHHFDNMRLLLADLHRRGYRRPGLWLDTWFDRIPAWEPIRAAFSLYAAQWFERPSVQIKTQPDLAKWLRARRVDALVTFGKQSQLTMLRARGWNVPGDLGLAGVDVDAGSEVSGILQDPESSGRETLRLLDGMIRHGVRGKVPHPAELLLPSSWQEGKTLRAVVAPPA